MPAWKPRRIPRSAFVVATVALALLIAGIEYVLSGWLGAGLGLVIGGAGASVGSYVVWQFQKNVFRREQRS